MVTPLTLFGTNTHATTVTTANTLVAGTGAAAVATTTLIGTSTGFGEVWSQGNTGAWPAGGSLGGVGPHGWLLDTTLLEGNTLLGGTFAATWTLFTSVGTIIADVYERVYLRSSGGTFTQIGTNLLKSGVSITSVATIVSIPGTSLPTTAFGTGDKVYRQLDLNITTNATGSGTATLSVRMGNSATAGVASCAQLVTAGYTTGGGGGGAPTVGGVALVANGTGVASFDHLRWTQFPDPSLSLANMGRVGSSLISWNATLPSSATTLQMLVSTDGANFTDVSGANGGSLPGITSQPSPTIDLFNSDNYRATVLGDNPLAYYRLDEASGFVAVDSASNLHGTISTSGITYTQPGALSELADSAMGFTGSPGRVTLPTGVNVSGYTALSLECWFYANTTAGVQALISQSSPGSSNAGVAILIINGVLYFLVGNGTSEQSVTQPITAGRWHHAVLVYDGTNLNMYLNNNQFSAALSGTVGATAETMVIGALNYLGLADYFTGSIDEVAIYKNIALTPGQVQAHYLAGVAGNPVYINTAGYGGSVAGWVVDTANSRLTATNGARAIFLSSTISTAEIDLLCDMDESDAGGLVFSFSDPSDYYSVAVADASAATGTPNRLTLYKMVAGVESQLAQAPIAFMRGTYHRIRAKILAGVITVTFDGIAALSYTDSTPLPAGSPGLIQNAGIAAHWALRTFSGALDLGIPGVASTVARFYQLWIQPQGTLLSGNPPGDVVSSTFVYTKEVLATADASVTGQVQDMTVAVFGPSIGQGALIPTASYVNTFIGNDVADLATKSNYATNIDNGMNLFFQGRTYVPAPWILNPVVDTQLSNVFVENANDNYSNRQVLTGVVATATITDTITGNSTATAFPLRFKIGPIPPIILLNGQRLIATLKGLTGADWYFANGDLILAQDPGGTVLAPTDVMTVTYTYTYITTVVRDNVAAQQALAAKEGTGTGIVENVTDVSALNLDVPSANAYGDILNARYSILGRTVTFDTYRPGLAVGQLIPAFIPQHQMTNVQLLITQVDIGVRTIRSGGGAVSQLVYSVTATENPNLGSWQRRLASVAIP